MRYILTLLAGLVVGGLLVFFLLVGAPGANPMPGTPVKPPEAGGDPPGTALITLKEDFFNTVLATIFRDMNAPSFPLKYNVDETGAGPTRLTSTNFQGGCPSSVVLLQEGSNHKTSVRMADGKIMAALAFNGSYNAPLVGCIRFTGWAQANLVLRFDQEKQTVYGQLNVEGVNLDTAPMLGGIVTGLVQAALNQRVNPIEILRGHQLRLSVPVKASDGTLNAQVKDVRAQVKDGVLEMHITYDFNGQKGQQPQS